VERLLYKSFSLAYFENLTYVKEKQSSRDKGVTLRTFINKNEKWSKEVKKCRRRKKMRTARS
jgi:hypothetical protein